MGIALYGKCKKCFYTEIRIEHNSYELILTSAQGNLQIKNRHERAGLFNIIQPITVTLYALIVLGLFFASFPS